MRKYSKSWVGRTRQSPSSGEVVAKVSYRWQGAGVVSMYRGLTTFQVMVTILLNEIIANVFIRSKLIFFAQ